jgi:hypothetical protein
MALYGNARHPAQDPSTPAPRGRLIGGNAVVVAHPVLAPDPIAGAWLGRLFAATTLPSPMAGGRFREGDKGAMQNRMGQDIGPLQNFRGKGLVGRGIVDRLGNVNGGPGTQPAYPGTGTTTAPSIRSALAGMDLPQILRT